MIVARQFTAWECENRDPCRRDVSGFCREAATHHSPGLQPWVTRNAKSALAAEARL